MLIFTSALKKSQNFQYGKYKYGVAHERRERRDEAIEIFGGYFPGFRDTMCAQNYKRMQLRRQMLRQCLLRGFQVEISDGVADDLSKD